MGLLHFISSPIGHTGTPTPSQPENDPLSFDIPWIFLHPGVFMIAGVWVMAGMWYLQHRHHWRDDPDLQARYGGLARGFGLWMSVPFGVLAYATLIGGADSFELLAYNPGNFYVWAFLASTFVVDFRFLYWTFAQDGAQKLGTLPSGFAGPLLVKVLAVFLPLCHTVFLIFALTIERPDF